MIGRIVFWGSTIAGIAVGLVMVAAAFGVMDIEWQSIVLLAMAETGLLTMAVCRFLLTYLESST